MSSAPPPAQPGPPPYQPGPPPYRPGPPPYQPGAPALRRDQHPDGGGQDARRTSRRGPALWIGLGVGAVVLVLAAVVIALQVTANASYDSAQDAWDDAVAEASTAQSALADAALTGGDEAAAAQSIVASAPDGLVDTAARDALAGAATALGDAATAAAAEADGQLPDATGARPVVFWELWGATDELRGEAADLEDRDGELTDAVAALEGDAGAVDDAAAAVYASAEGAGAAFQAGHIDARNAEVIAFIDAREEVSLASGVGLDAVDAMSAYSAAASAVIASEQEELASIGGPLYDGRLAAQAFARSMAGGVLVEFDWAPIVYGAGEGGSVGGYTTWNYDHGGHAVIQLSNSVAELWPADVAQNLVAHEVGHAISAKCSTLYDDTDQASIEAFATAWAISMGYTGEGNGVSLYGYPSPETIAAAATCR